MRLSGRIIMDWDTVIGLEVHAELSTQSKIFCSCSTKFGAEPNTQVCPVCCGMPGALPSLNKSVVDYALRLGLALECDIGESSVFDRKNYFYPDLPKAYQISQLYAPICTNGKMEIEPEGEKATTISIKEIHIEEDAGKLIHANDITLMDYNRCGVPLLEIVTEPNFSTVAQVVSFLEKLRQTLLYLDICDCKMQEGSMRADINLSVRAFGSALGTRTETKNLNSFKAIARAITHEQKRQIDMLEKGTAIEQQTRRWDDDRGVSFAMRTKETAMDYRYFPEPDLLPIIIDKEWINTVAQALPELAHKKRERFVKNFGIQQKDAQTITSDKNICDLFEALITGTNEPTECANLITGDIMRLLKATNTQPENLNIDHKKLAFLIKHLKDKKINRATYKQVTEEVFKTDCNPQYFIEKNNLLLTTDPQAMTLAVKEVIAQNQKIVQDYKNGKEKALGSLIGQVMKKMQGKAEPVNVRQMLLDNM